MRLLYSLAYFVLWILEIAARCSRFSNDLCSRDVIILISRFFIIFLKPVTQRIRFPVVIISSIWIIGVNFFGWIKRRIICYIPVLYTIHWTKCSLCLKKLTLGFLECFKVYPKQQWRNLRIYHTCWNEYLTYTVFYSKLGKPQQNVIAFDFPMFYHQDIHVNYLRVTYIYFFLYAYTQEIFNGHSYHKYFR